MKIPSATYRLQLQQQFTFADATELVPYLDRLGVSDLYLSPVSTARPGSVHGYDVIDHDQLNPELGGAEQFQRLATVLRKHGLGVLLDVVPNHMCVAGHFNARWIDVLENGPASVSARFFDIDWRPPKPELLGKVLLPVLGQQYGRMLEDGICLRFEGGAFLISFYETSLPLAPRTWSHLLEPALADLRDRFGDEEPRVLELESIIRSIGHLPPRTEPAPARIRERQHEREIIGRRLAALVQGNGTVAEAIDRAVQSFNGHKGDPRSFDRLEALLADQAYRLSHWRVAADEINYRRFFDINDLAAVRVEDPVVFDLVHRLPLALVHQGVVSGFRIDHVDGLHDPEKYLRDLQRCFREALDPRPEDQGDAGGYVVVEKILEGDERLPAEWPVAGTTGYEFLNRLSGVLVDGAGVRRLRENATGAGILPGRFSDIVYECKKLVLGSAMSAELTVLARRLDRISEQHRYTRDFTRNGLQAALGEVVACFPIYRTYVRTDDTTVCDRDRQAIETAVRSARRRNPVLNESLFDFVRQVLLLEVPGGLGEAQQAERREFVLRFQQITGPVMAKGLEDTAFYRYFPLAALAEVGGDPDSTGISVAEFHALNRERWQKHPHGLSATATHDTKRGEDTRARLLVLAELPQLWSEATGRWGQLLSDHRRHVAGVQAPGLAEEHLFYQTLLGACPPGGLQSEADFGERVNRYLGKALLEAKLNTSWINRDEAYEAAVAEFVTAALDPERSRAFVEDFARFFTLVARPGYYTSLSQTVLKLAAPGVPDLYQGTELWDLSLVDPDNRRPVDWARRRADLDAVLSEGQRDPRDLCDRLLREPEDGRIKLFVIARALHFRRAQRGLFEQGDYQGLETRGALAEHLVAFSRTAGGRSTLAVVGRHFARLCEGGAVPVGAAWQDTAVAVSEALATRRYRDVFSGLTVVPRAGALPVAEVLAHLPVALLEAV